MVVSVGDFLDDILLLLYSPFVVRHFSNAPAVVGYDSRLLSSILAEMTGYEQKGTNAAGYNVNLSMFTDFLLCNQTKSFTKPTTANSIMRSRFVHF